MADDHAVTLYSSATITNTKKNAFSLKVGIAQMLRGGAVVEVTTIDQAKNCDFYLWVGNRPIMEDGNGVRFTPLCLSYRVTEEDMVEANLDEETENWANVDDFR